MSQHFFPPFRGWWLALVCLLAAGGARAATEESVDPRSLIVPELPGWIVTPRPLPPPPPVATSSAMRMLVVEQQASVAAEEDFHHIALRVESESGLQEIGQVALSFSKTYETLRWHYLRVWRGGVKRDVLDAAALQVLRQEEDADRFVYHGRLTALAVLHDIRVGDIVEYAFTRVGRNPVFGGRFSTSFGGGFSMPTDVMFYRVVTPALRPVHLDMVGRFPAEVVTAQKDDTVEYSWTASNLAAIHAVADAPSWEVQYPFVQVSEFGSWQEVADWGRKLFDVSAKISPEMRERIASLTASLPTTEQKANALVRFVQDEIRYLAVHLGESTHRPFPPDEVLRRRFGDCKDKALLLATLLRELGLDAQVALVNSEWGKGVRGLQASPLAFDHAIVRVVWAPKAPAMSALAPPAAILQQPVTLPDVSELWVKQKRYTLFTPESPFDPGATTPGKFNFTPTEIWLDATSSLQGGALADRHHANFGYALVLAPDVTKLQSVAPVAVDASLTQIHETYRAKDYTSPAQLEVVATYRGAAANYYRYVRRYSEPTQTAQQLTGTLARFFPHVRAIGATVWEDDREKNIVTARSTYEVPEFWTKDAKGKLRIAEVYPWALSDRLPRPEATDRTLAFALAYPYTVRHEIELTLPKSWPSGSERTDVNDATFSFETRSGGEGNHVWINYQWRTEADAVPAARMGEWSKKMSEVRGALGYQLRQNIRLLEEMKREGLVWPLVAAGVLGVVAGTALGVWLYRRRPASVMPPLLPDDALTGLGGFLVLVALGIVVRPLLLTKGFWPAVQLMGNHPNWVSRTDAESAGYAAGYATLLFVETWVTGLLLAWSLVMIPQFFRRKISLPITFVAFVGALLLWSPLHLAWLYQLPLFAPSARQKVSDISNIVGLVAVAAVWIPYMFLSRRVKLTFTR